MRGVAKELASWLLERLDGGSRVLSSCIDRHRRGRGIGHRGFLCHVRDSIITYRNCCHLPRICNRDMEDWLPTGFPSASRPAATHGCGTAGALRMGYMYTCEPTLIVPGHPYQTDLHQKGVAFLHSLIPGQATSQHNTTHTHQFISVVCELGLCIRLFSTTLPTSTSHPQVASNYE